MTKLNDVDKRKRAKAFIEEKLGLMYETVYIHDMDCFVLPNGTVIHVDTMNEDYNPVLVEYADNIEEAKIYRFEDGERFYLEDYPDLDTVFQEVLTEIVSESD